jgi:carbamoyl-phosphate synthase large subunit
MSTSPIRTIAVTGMNATDNPAPGVAVLRCLRGGGLGEARVIGLAYDALDPGIYAKDIVDDVFMLPYPSSSPENFFERLREIHRRTELSMIIPTLDAELPAFIELEPHLRELGIQTLLPTREQFDARSKANLQALARRAGFRTPQTVLVGSAEEVRRIEEQLAFPLFLKGLFYGAKLVTNVEEALSAFHSIVAEWGFPVIAQAAVPGADREERNVVALGDGRGGLVGAVAMKKLAVTDKGKGWAGVTIRDNALLEITERFVRSTQWRGPFELEVVLGRDRTYYVIEINPRFPAWVYLAASAGVNLPARAVAIATGQDLPELNDYSVGTMFVRISIDQIATISELERVVMSGEWRRSR